MQMETTVVKEQAFEKQIGGCMAGFFNIFDRPHLLSPKRFALPKHLSSSSSSSPLTSKTAQSEPSSSPLDSGNPSVYSTPELRSPAPDENLPITSELKQGSSRSPWRFSKEAPRLSLDSRAVVDAKGSLKPRQIRMDGPGSGSPSVIARLMGLEALPAAQPLQRSASESRVSREYRFVDSSNFQNPQCRDDDKSISSSTGGGEDDPAAEEFHIRSGRAQPARAPPPPPPPVPQRYVVRRKSFFDSADFFPEARQTSGFDSPAPTTDLETLKQLLEARRLKGLLHSSTNRNLVHQSRIKPPIGITSPSRRDESKGRRRSRSENSVKSPNRRPTLKERSLPSWRRPEDGVQTRNRINRGGRGPIEDEQCSEEMWKVDEYKRRQGNTLLERCDKLLHSIAEMAASEAAGDSQPSPVSVLDASLYNDESSPSPVMKRSLDFTESEDESWGGSMSSSSFSDSEYVYISDILRASDCLPQECDIFSLLEKKQQYLKGKRTSAQERRLIFDAVQEIVGRIRRLPPWIIVESDKMHLIWSEFQKIRNKSWSTEEEDLVGYVCGVLGRDLSEDSWRDCQVEMSEAVLDIERLVFKDLIGETIGHMAALSRSGSLRRRLLF